MLWKETTMLEQKLEFINEWRAGNFNLSELCREFGISRPTAYKNTSNAINKRELKACLKKTESLNLIPKKRHSLAQKETSSVGRRKNLETLA